MTDDLYIRPVSGHFQLDEVQSWLDTRPDAVERASSAFVICGTPTRADLVHRADVASERSFETVVSVWPDLITVTNEGDTESMRSAIDFMEWLFTRYVTRIAAAWGERDITESVSAQGIAQVYSQGVRDAELRWKAQLLEIGFFDELPHGHSTSLTVEQAARATPIPEEQELVAYLSSGRLYRAGEILIPVGADDTLGPAHVFTDGKYVWPADLRWHVQRDHVRLPRHFLIHARANGWRVPEVDLGALPGSENIPKLTASEVAWYTRSVVQPSMPDGETCSLEVAHGLVTTTALLRSGAADAVYRGYTGRGTPVLVTLTMRHDDSYDELADRLRFDIEGITPLLHVGEVDPASNRGFRDVLVEIEPRGRSILDASPLPELAAIRCGIDVAEILAAAYEPLIVLGGLAPEVIYVDDDLRFSGLTPRSRRFVASVDLRSGGLRSYKLPYSGHEALVLGRGSEEEGDVFALCASLFHAITGRHPFGAELPEIFQRIAAATPLPYPGSPALGAVLASGLVSDPAKRPTALELATALAGCTSTG